MVKILFILHSAFIAHCTCQVVVMVINSTLWAMPRCEGPPDAGCPNKRNDNSVVFTQGEMWLCPACIDIIFGQLTDQTVNKRRDSDATERKLLALNQDEDNMPCSQNEADYNRQSATTRNEEDNIPSVSVLNPLSAYMLFALKSGTAENVRLAVIAHFPLNVVLDAKTAMWAACDNAILGDKLKRQDSQTRTKLEAHVQDILIALHKLDRMDKLPVVLIDSRDFAVIPRSHPEKLNNLSLVDRPNRLEARLSGVQEVLDKTVAENLYLRDKFEDFTLYAKVASRAATHDMQVQQKQQVQKQVQRPQQQHQVQQQPQQQQQQQQHQWQETQRMQHQVQQTKVQQVQQQQRQDDVDESELDGVANNLRQHDSVERKSQQGQSPRGRGGSAYHRGGSGVRGGGRGRGGRSDVFSRDPYESFQRFLERVLSSFSLATGVSRCLGTSGRAGKWSEDDEGFMMPRYQEKKTRQHERKKHKVITGCHKPGNGGFRGAPEPSRDIFIYRVHQDTSKRDIEDGIRGRNFEARDLVCISSEQSVFKSFKLTVPASQLSSLLTDEFPWPEGVKVRRFFSSRRDQAPSGDSHIHIYNYNYGNEFLSVHIIVTV